MKIQSIKTVYFSATGNTKNVVKLIGETIARNMNLSYKEIDFTLPQAHKDSYEFTKEELVIFGTPVYAGRVPNKVLPMIQGLFQGNDAFAVPVVTFGNRNYDNALIELRNELENNHFHTIAAGAFVAQHAFTDQLATMRPGKSDQEEIRGFAKRIVTIVEMIKTLGEIPKPVHVKGIEPIPPYYTPLGIDGKPAKFLKAKPKTKSNCDHCDLCVKVCPMGSINSEDPSKIDGICIKCQACVKKCPKQAKYFDDPAFLSHVEMLKRNYQRAAKNEIFVSDGRENEILGRLSADAIAANSVSTTMFQYLKVITIGEASASAVLIGTTIGENRGTTKVKEYSKTLQVIYLIIGSVLGISLFFLRIPLLSLYDLTQNAYQMADQILIILSIVMVGMSYQMPTGIGIIKGGGDVKYMMYLNLISTWAIVMPLSFLGAFVWKLPVPMVVLLLNSDQLFKCIPTYLYVKKDQWIKVFV